MSVIKNITVVAPLHHYSAISYDTCFYNIIIPLKILGYNVNIFDPTFSQIPIEEFEKLKGTPDLLLCILTGSDSEPLDYIRDATKSGRFITFNIFCDDTWRFETFSSKVCFDFSAVSTPEPSAIQKYKKIGYNNVQLLPWPVSSDFYNISNFEKEIDISTFSRYITPERELFEKLMKDVSQNSISKYGASFEEMVLTMNSSKMVLNLSTDSKGSPQMKMRMFEAPATNSLLITQEHKGLEEFFDINKEFISFKTTYEFQAKARWLLNNPQACKRVASLAHARWNAEYESKIVLRKLINSL